MTFDAHSYGDGVAAILALDGDGGRLLALAQPKCTSQQAAALLKAAKPNELLPQAFSADAAIAGLYLYFGCWAEAHETAQNIETPEGSYWHAIVHRQEPDAGNSEYWFRQVGRHPIFTALRENAAELGVDFGPEWSPTAFIEMCDQARGAPGSEMERQAMAVQMAEWQLLFDYCARPPK